MNHYTYADINMNDLGLVDFSQTITTSSNTIRISNDNLFFIIKWWDNQTPTFITDGTITPVSTMNQTQCLSLMLTANWITVPY